MTFNNSIIDLLFTSYNYDGFSGVISYDDYQINTVEFRNEFDIDFIRLLLQNPRPEFISELVKRKRGRPNKLNKRKKEHSSSSTDNIIRKIQTHFLNFVISFGNDSVKGFFGAQKYKFANFIYKEKSKVSFDYLDELKNSTIGDLLFKMTISPKFKCCKDNNINNLKQLEQIPFFQSLFSIKYLDLFAKYYNNKQPLKELLINGVKISFSSKTRSFSELLQRKKNKKLNGFLIDIAENFYLNDNIGDSADTDTKI
jgi:hypothetical protein